MELNSRSKLLCELNEKWKEFGPTPEARAPRLFFCPGRINLIGEHIDYNGGLVFPLAIGQGVYALHSPRQDRTLNLRSLNRPGDVHTLTLEDIPKYRCDNAKSWVAYPLATMEILIESGVSLAGADILFYGDLPLGSGVSSSAAIEVLTAYMTLTAGSGSPTPPSAIDRVALALSCQRAEREKIGVQCGIMDQFSVAKAKAGTALALNCANLDHTYVPFQLDQYRVVVVDSKKERTLAGSKYNQRKAECDKALELINHHRKIDNLCQATLEEVHSVLGNDPTLKKRARHVVSENLRVHNAIEALKCGDLKLLGELLLQSHDSLKNDYEVTGPELDTLVRISSQIPGCIGARMTGAGFGGCIIALVEVSALSKFEAELISRYQESCGLVADCFATSAEEGVCELSQ